MAGSQAKASDADFETAQQILRGAGVDAELIGASKLGVGVKSRVLQLDLATGEDLALKVYTMAGAADREIAAYTGLGEAVEEAPRLLASAVSSDLAPHGYLLMTRVPGVELRVLLREATDEQLIDAYRKIGELLARFHQVQMPLYWPMCGDEGGFDNNVSWFEDRVGLALRAFRECGANRYLAWRCEQWFAEHRDGLAECTGPRFCHGDMHARNLRALDADGPLKIVGVIDFEMSFAGDPAMDLVRAYHYVYPPRNDLWEAMLEGYGDPPEWLESVFDAYWLYHEIELWSFFANGGNSRAPRSILRRVARQVGASRWRRFRSRVAAIVWPER